MQTINSIAELEGLYEPAMPASLTKVLDRISPLYKQWIDASRFVVLSTAGPEGTDGSPRGDNGPVVRVVDDKTVWLPDWQGNNRIDSLRNIVRDGRVSLMFMVPGCKNVVRINGSAALTADAVITASFERKGKHPKTVIVLTVGEIYFQCAKALMRSRLWESEDESERVPSAGEFIKAISADFDAQGYDAGYADYAKSRMW
ncbi:MAG: pyridoxamine 5'-phosphate oxidase family protein [Woeseiaceae bacterium]|nr:pyridoxamine 5'-phosphate oxidase family protein [Woeseiaceae bacterium]